MLGLSTSRFTPTIHGLRALLCSTLLGSIFLHLAIESSSPQVRRSTINTLERLAATLPEHVNLAALAAASAFLSREKPKLSAAGDEQESTSTKEGRLPAFILACAAFGDDCPQDIKERLLWDWAIVAHHPGPSEYQRITCRYDSSMLTISKMGMHARFGSSCVRRRRSTRTNWSLHMPTPSSRRCSIPSTATLRYRTHPTAVEDYT